MDINNLPAVKRKDGTIDVPPNDCNITTVEAEYDRAMAYKPPCFGDRKGDNLRFCKRCNWPSECQKETENPGWYEKQMKERQAKYLGD